MLLVASLGPLIVLATRVVAGPSTGDLVHIPITKHCHPGGSTGRQPEKHESSTPDVLLDDVIYGYTVNISVGDLDPPVYYQLAFDTGSANTWVGENKSYVISKTSVKTNSFLNLTYRIGHVYGTEYLDTVTIGRDAVISQQSIGVTVPSNSSGFSPFDGVLGVGPSDLTQGTLHPNNSRVVPTVMDNLVRQGTIKKNVLGVYFEPSNSTSSVNANSQVTLGGVDSTKYIGKITYHNITKKAPASHFFGVDASFQYGKEPKTIIHTSPGVIDTGTTLIGLSTSAYDYYIKATGAVYDNNTQALRISRADYSKLEPLIFTIDGTHYVLNENAQIFPRTLNTIIGGDPEHLYLNVFDLGPSGKAHNISFIMGMVFLERYYSVYDIENSRVGFARTRFTDATDIN